MDEDLKNAGRSVEFPVSKYKVSKEWIHGLFNEIKQAILTEAIATDCSKEFLANLNDLHLDFSDEAAISLNFGRPHPVQETSTGHETVKEVALKQSPAQEKSSNVDDDYGEVLIIDEDRAARDYFKTTAEALGVQVHLDEDLDEGLENFKENKDAIKLVILPLNTLEANDDVEARFKAFRGVKEGITLLFSTDALKDKSIPEVLATADNVRFIEKPFQEDEIVSKIKKILKLK